ncbi:MAG TPA: pyrroline-5-carboxylate reductase [Terriglobales bacterium]|nr:pyrroline-5-carboxylate reductase [Terriglobales bacterium]
MADKSAKHKLAVLGAGKMGGILVQGFLKHKLATANAIWATLSHAEKVAKRSADLGVRLGTDNREAVRHADVVLVCVKPQTVGEVLDEVKQEMTPEKLVISIAASVPTSFIEARLPARVPVIRAMPNTPSILGAGITGLAAGQSVKPAQMEVARRLFETVGRTVVVDEKHMDAVTALSASGPAYIYIILESLAEAGVKVGLPRDLATLLAAQTTLGAARMVLETGDHPALLKDAVTTPAGCTIDGIMELEEGKLRVTLIKAVVKATQRAKELMFA